MLFLPVGPSNDVYSALITHAPGQNATVYPDENVGQATFGSWYYQLLIRILPSAIMIASGLAAAAYFADHMRIIDGEYRDAVAARRRSLARWATFTRESFRLPHVVLAIDMVTVTSCGAVLAIGGFYSTSNLPYSLIQYFLSLLGGWSFASSLLSASVWVRHMADLVESETLLTRVVRGDYPVAFYLLVTIPIAVDTAVTAVWTTNHYSSLLISIAAGLLFLLQLTVGLHVLVYVIRYYRFAHDVQAVTSAAAVRAPGMNALLARLSRCALGMSLSMISVCLGSILAVSTSFLFSPSGWTTCFSRFNNGRALDSAFRVAMFKPRPTRQPQVPAVGPSATLALVLARQLCVRSATGIQIGADVRLRLG